MIPKKWEIELTLPKGRIRTFVYSDDGTNILNRFEPKYECKVIGILKEEDDKENKKKKTESEKLQDELEPIDE
mgnify:CR=1 FL=1